MIKAYILKKPRTINYHIDIDRMEIQLDDEGLYIQVLFRDGNRIASIPMCNIEDITFGDFTQGDIVIEKCNGSKNLVVEYYDEDSCGEGCCQFLKIVGRDYSDWPTNFELDLEANGIMEVK